LEFYLRAAEARDSYSILAEGTSFYGLNFGKRKCTDETETEELVDWIIQSTKSEVGNMKLKVLDIGTGSGCIAISLAKKYQMPKYMRLMFLKRLWLQPMRNKPSGCYLY
jgi:methylase of polypeptide subunit release factors